MRYQLDGARVLIVEGEKVTHFVDLRSRELAETLFQQLIRSVKQAGWIDDATADKATAELLASIHDGGPS